MIIRISTLNKDLKQALLNNAFTKDQARQIYQSHLEFKKDRIGEFKLTLFVLGLLFAFFVYLYLSGSIKESEFTDMIPFFMVILLIVSPLIYFASFGAYNIQFINAMSVHYSDIVEEFEKGKIEK